MVGIMSPTGHATVVLEKSSNRITDDIPKALGLLAQKPLHDLFHVHIALSLGCRGL